MNNLLTVCIPMFNAETKIKKCIFSILNSTIDVDIIVIDDNSTDESYNVVKSLNIKKLLLIKNKYSKGPGSARNYGIYLCKSKYITFCDADDYVPNFAYEKLLKTAINNNSDLVIGQYLRKIDNSTWYINKNLKLKYISDNYNHINDEEIIQINPSVWNKIYKTSIIKDNNINFQKSFIAEDLEFTSKYFSFCKIVNLIEDVVYFYHTITSQKNIISNITCDKFIQGLACVDLSTKYIKDINEKKFTYILNNSFKFIFNKLFQCNPLDSIIVLKKIKFFLYKYQKLCNHFVIYSLLKKDLNTFLSCNIIDYYVDVNKKNTFIDIEKFIENKYENNLENISIRVIDIYLYVLIKNKSYTKAMDIIYNIENSKKYRYIYLKYKYELLKVSKKWDIAVPICRELINYNRKNLNSKYYYEMAYSLIMCNKYYEAYRFMICNICNNISYWSLRAKLAEFFGDYIDAINAWKNIAKIDISKIEIVNKNIREIKNLIYFSN